MIRPLALAVVLAAAPAWAAPAKTRQYSVPKATNSLGLQAWATARKRTGGNLVFSPFAHARATAPAHADAYDREAAALMDEAKSHGFELTLSSRTACLKSSVGIPAAQKEDFDFAGKKIKVDMSVSGGPYLYFENSTFQAVAWPIGKSKLEAVALVPKSTFWLKDIERDLAWGQLAKPLSKLAPQKVTVRMPRLKAGDSRNCVDTLLEGEGAPAAGDKILKADRPFLFLVRHSGTGLILFIGRVADPR